jgi:hypothetical protein
MSACQGNLCPPLQGKSLPARQVLALNYTPQFLCWPPWASCAQVVTSGLAVITLHQKCAVIFGIDRQDTSNIEANLYCNLLLGFLAMLVGRSLRVVEFGAVAPENFAPARKASRVSIENEQLRRTSSCITVLTDISILVVPLR